MTTINGDQFKEPAAPPDNERQGTSLNLVTALSRSKVFQDYERAFTEIIGLPISLRPIESWQLVHHGRRKENPLCALLAQKGRSCAGCLQVQQELSDKGRTDPVSVACPIGLTDLVVPVRMGEQLLGFLQTGQAFRRPPTEAQFQKLLRLLKQWEVEMEVSSLRSAYFNTRVLTARQWESMITMLAIFAQHLTMLSNQIMLQQQNAEPPVVTRAKEYIDQHQTEDLSLSKVARSVNTSTFYFCKMFKKATGINFTDYISRVRIEKAKKLLLNPNLRVSEIAYEVGFQSLTHFNRVFKRITGQSPTNYRAHLTRA